MPTPTLTFTPSATPTPSVPLFASAAFTYDGDGKRVKSVLTTNLGSTTAFFIGNYYEVTGSTITKYYYAGTQQIAMRKNGTLNFILTDHLGSTSLITDANGAVINETKYKAWGEVRYSSGAEQTKYTYTGQYSYTSDFGLMFYNARWYDSSLSRFASADTVIPNGVQGLDRYAYVNNAPTRYIDPTGHDVDCGISDPYCVGKKPKDGVKTSTPIVINVCGYGATGTCQQQNPNDPNYQYQVPLSNITNWVGSANTHYFTANSDIEKEIAAKAIYDFIVSTLNENKDATFILVGHSAGADTVVWAVWLFLEGGGDPSRIKGVVLLDSYLFTGDGSTVGYSESSGGGVLDGPLNNQKSADQMIRAGIPVLSLASQDKVNESGDHFTDFPTLSPPLSVGGGHFELAIDLVIFTTYIEPFLNEVK